MLLTAGIGGVVHGGYSTLTLVVVEGDAIVLIQVKMAAAASVHIENDRVERLGVRVLAGELLGNDGPCADKHGDFVDFVLLLERSTALIRFAIEEVDPLTGRQVDRLIRAGIDNGRHEHLVAEEILTAVTV